MLYIQEQHLRDLIFSYGYGCCTFKNNICGDWPDILDDMLDSSNPFSLEFFDKSRCPLALAADEATDTKVGQGRAVGDSKRGVVAKE